MLVEFLQIMAICANPNERRKKSIAFLKPLRKYPILKLVTA